MTAGRTLGPTLTMLVAACGARQPSVVAPKGHALNPGSAEVSAPSTALPSALDRFLAVLPPDDVDLVTSEIKRTPLAQLRGTEGAADVSRAGRLIGGDLATLVVDGSGRPLRYIRRSDIAWSDESVGAMVYRSIGSGERSLDWVAAGETSTITKLRQGESICWIVPGLETKGRNHFFIAVAPNASDCSDEANPLPLRVIAGSPGHMVEFAERTLSPIGQPRLEREHWYFFSDRRRVINHVAAGALRKTKIPSPCAKEADSFAVNAFRKSFVVQSSHRTCEISEEGRLLPPPFIAPLPLNTLFGQPSPYSSLPRVERFFARGSVFVALDDRQNPLFYTRNERNGRPVYRLHRGWYFADDKDGFHAWLFEDWDVGQHLSSVGSAGSFTVGAQEPTENFLALAKSNGVTLDGDGIRNEREAPNVNFSYCSTAGIVLPSEVCNELLASE
jgi:hypothetical protein